MIQIKLKLNIPYRGAEEDSTPVNRTAEITNSHGDAFQPRRTELPGQKKQEKRIANNGELRNGLGY